MSDNTATNPGTGGDSIRTIDRTLSFPVGTAKTQVVALDAGGEAGESLVNATNPLPTTVSGYSASDPTLAAALSNDAPIMVAMVGSNDGPFAGVNPIELAMDDASGLALNIRRINPHKADANNALVLSDAPAAITLVGVVGIPLIIDTTGYQSLNITSATLAGTVSASDDLTLWTPLSGTPRALGGLTSSVNMGAGYSFPCLARFIRITPTAPGYATAYLRVAAWNGAYTIAPPAPVIGTTQQGNPPVSVLDAPSQIGVESTLEALARTNQLLTAIAYYLKELPIALNSGNNFVDEPAAFREDTNMFNQ